VGNFSEQPPANLGTPSTEPDPVARLFSADYVFGVRTYAVDDTPGPSGPVAGPATSEDDPIDVTTPADPAGNATPAAMGGGSSAGSSSLWVQWPSGQSMLLVSLGGRPVRSLWLPSVPFAVAIAPGSAPGSVMYALTIQGAELVPIPGGQTQVALTAVHAPATWGPMWVYVSTEDYAPSKSASLAAVVTPPSATPYAELIISDPTLQHFWPLADAPGVTACADLGPGNIPLLALNGVTLGASSFLPNGQTCAQSAGSSGGGLIPQSPIPGVDGGGAIATVEFWVMPLTQTGVYLEGMMAPGEDHGFEIYTTLNDLAFWLGYTNFDSHVTFTLYAPHHLVATKNGVDGANGGIGDIYLDGNLVQTVSNSRMYANSFGFLYDCNTDTSNTPAKICNVAMYTGVLSLAQVQAHYAAGLAKT